MGLATKKVSPAREGASTHEKASVSQNVVPVKFTASGTPYVESAVSAISPEAVRQLVRARKQRLRERRSG